MFHLYITLAYIIPNIYLYFRIRHLFIGRDHKLLYTVVYLLIASVYPVTQGFSEENLNSFVQLLSSVAGYILPFFLYLFLSVLLYDLFLIINMLSGFISPERRKSYSYRLYMLTSLVLLSIAVVAAGIINLNTIRVSEYTIEVPRKNSKIDHLRIAFVADIHIQQNTSIHFIERFVSRINTLKPDLMLYVGDIVEGDNENETTKTIESSMQKIVTRYGTYGVTGNHEFYGGKGQSDFFGRLGITMLGDTVIRIDSSFYLAGRNDQHIGERKNVSRLFGGIAHDLPVILMDHRPTQLQEVSNTMADVQVSGHTHNGQMFPVSLITHSVYELSWGYKKIRNTHFFVTSGLRLWGPPVRTAGKSEIMLINLNFKN
jgi:predicted MPP superfamily phosphohydrolase